MTAKTDSLINRVLFTILILVIYRIGSFIPVPVVDLDKVSTFANVAKSGIFGVFNSFSGGSIGRVSIFALGIMPYITSSIIIQLIVATTPELKKRKKEEGDIFQEKINQWTKYLTILIGFGQSFGISSLFVASNIHAIDPTQFKIISAFTMLCGTLILIWFGTRISIKGIGNGTSLIIFTGIIAEAPHDIGKLLNLAKNGILSPIELFVLFAIFCITVIFVVLFEKSNRMVYVQYPRQVQQFMNQNRQSVPNFLPLKINPAGVIPPIFASSIILLPSTIATIFKDSHNIIIDFIIKNLTHGTITFVLFDIVLIIFFSFFYNNIVFDADEMSAQLRKGNIFIPGIRPGEETARLFKKIMLRLSLIGALYLCVICSLPELLSPKYGYSFLIGGTGLLIVVNVITDTMAAIQTSLLPSKYEKTMKKAYR